MIMEALTKDIISNSDLIHSGYPAVYQLRPKKETFGTLRRITVGENNVIKTNKTILLVGETGAGKSTLINTLVNYSMGVKWEDGVWFQVLEGEKKNQTLDVIVYQIFSETLPYSLTIIDTPGFGDTRGIEHDVKKSQRLLDLFRSEDGVHEVHAVGLVMKAPDNQLSDRLKYVLGSLMSLFGEHLENNIVALFTHSHGRKLKAENALKALENANIKCAKKENRPVFFLFKNQQTIQRTNTAVRGLEYAWTVSERGMNEFTSFLEKTEPQKLHSTKVGAVNEHIQLRACIQTLTERIKLAELKQTEIKQMQEALKKYDDEMEKNEKFTVEVEEVRRVKEPVRSKTDDLNFKVAVCCNVCEETCHHPGCTMAWSPEHCEVIKDGHCTVCTGKCPVSDHSKEKWRYVTKIKKVQKTKKEIETYYENTNPDSEKTVKLQETLQKKMEKHKTDKVNLLEEAYQHVIKTEKIVLNVDTLSTHAFLSFLIEKMKEKGDTEKVLKLQNLEGQTDGKVEAALQTIKMRKILSNSVLIQSGPPALYKLNAKKQKTGTLTRMTVGEKNPNEPNRTILLVGETGAGKSPLINALVNYALGVNLKDKTVQIVEEERNQSETDASEIIVYEIFDFEVSTLPYSLTIIDTPGFGHATKPEQDVSIRQRLMDLFRSEDGVHEVHAVGLVMKATDTLLSDHLKHSIDSVVSLLGSDVKENIVALITHSEGIIPANALKAVEDANIKCAKNLKNQPILFLFNNPQNTLRKDENEYFLSYAKRVTKKGMCEFVDFLEKTSAQRLEIPVDRYSLSKKESILTSLGSPAVYQLKAKKQRFGTLTRITVGEKDGNKTNKVILLVGKTGSGKSTLINALLNYSMGVKWEDKVWFQIVEEEKKSQTKSQTSDVIVYEIFGFEDKTLPYSLTIIDTPGFGDTRGIEYDVIVNQRLFDLFRSNDGVHEVHAVGLVMKASVNRLTDQTRYVFDSVMSLFGKNLENNIIALITHSDGIKPKDALQALEAAKIKCARNHQDEPVYFLFNNCQHEDEEEEDEVSQKATYQTSERGMREFTAFLEKAEPQKLEKTVEVLSERISLTACIQNLEERIKQTELKQTEIIQIQEALKKHEDEMKRNENFTIEIDEVYKDKEPFGGGMWWLVFFEGAVCCNVCEETCHYPGCTMAWKSEHCEVMKEGRCTVCTNKCPASDHVKDTWRYVTKTRKIHRTEVEIKEKYEMHKAKSQYKSSFLENLEKEMVNLKSEKSRLLEEAHQCVFRLNQTALNVNSLSTYVHLDFLLEKMKEEGDTKKIQELKSIKSRVDKGARIALQYMNNMLKGARNKVKKH